MEGHDRERAYECVHTHMSMEIITYARGTLAAFDSRFWLS